MRQYYPTVQYMSDQFGPQPFSVAAFVTGQVTVEVFPKLLRADQSPSMISVFPHVGINLTIPQGYTLKFPTSLRLYDSRPVFFGYLVNDSTKQVIFSCNQGIEPINCFAAICFNEGVLRKMSSTVLFSIVVNEDDEFAQALNMSISVTSGNFTMLFTNYEAPHSDLTSTAVAIYTALPITGGSGGGASDDVLNAAIQSANNASQAAANASDAAEAAMTKLDTIKTIYIGR